MARHNWRDVRAERATPEIERKIAAEGFKLRLAELRAGQGHQQRDVADALETSQANVSRIEHETDLKLSTLDKYVTALGGELHVSVTFPDEPEPIELIEHRSSERSARKSKARDLA